jgi:hypothetical protein
LKKFVFLWVIAVVLEFIFINDACAQETEPEEEIEEKAVEEVGFLSDLELEVHGFYEMQAGYRVRKNKYEKDMSVMENRFQFDIDGYADWAEFKFKGDFVGDLVLEEGDFDFREGFIFVRPLDDVDLKVGRQILTWGTGDLLFINDLFPKDWQSFFIGRDVEYLKAPSDAAKVSFFDELANLDIVLTPKFDPDRYIKGERISYWNSLLGREAGDDAVIHTDKPDEWFDDYELSARLYKNIDNYELAFYGYRGYWKSPGGFNSTFTQAVFPRLNVYGGSVRGNVSKGIGNVEFGYYDSVDDSSGKNGLISNSELRFLVGYVQEIAKDFTAGVQYYLEHMLDYGDYKNSEPVGLDKDRNRHLITLRLTKLLMNQNLTLSMFTYYSPSDDDAYLRGNTNYKVSDNLSVELGGNVFFGHDNDTFFGQFENNSNVYTAVRYSF